MPDNNDNGASNTDEPTGTAQLPFARVKKIVSTDQDIQIMSNAGAFVITLATEMFIQHLAKLAHSVAKSDRKPRRNIQYRDLATAISNHDNLEFLIDVVPQTVTYKQIKEKSSSAAQRKTNGRDHVAVEAGQTTLNMSNYQGRATPNELNNGDDQNGNSDAQLHKESNSQATIISQENSNVQDNSINSVEDFSMN